MAVSLNSSAIYVGIGLGTVLGGATLGRRGGPEGTAGWLATKAVYWLREPVPRRLLASLAAATGPVTHDLLDGLQHPARAVRHLRAALAADRVLPVRDEHLAQLERWLPHAVARVEDPAERQVVRSFATWHHLRLLRRIAEKQPVTFHQATVVRREIKAAIQLVSWIVRVLDLAEQREAGKSRQPICGRSSHEGPAHHRAALPGGGLTVTDRLLAGSSPEVATTGSPATQRGGSSTLRMRVAMCRLRRVSTTPRSWPVISPMRWRR
ncbi:hypothetical protein ACIRYZ_07550 [Kitasatospora sp. NPDC101155]|uniref:hypothetical protein n=1 Tax=Kitasatospora sp. NPDC101155 TaxID=3364097 RepID=UPI003830F820